MKYAYHTKWYDKWYRGGANHPHYSPPQCHLSLHLVWYAHFIFYSVYIINDSYRFIGTMVLNNARIV